MRGLRFLVPALLLWSLQPTAAGPVTQLVLGPSNVIGSSGAYSSLFLAWQILDNQTGTVTEPVQSGYWLNPDGGPANAYIVIDLGGLFQIGELDFFNTHNAQYLDRGTGNFNVQAGNAVIDLGGGNYNLTGTMVTILTDTLAAAASDPIPAQTFPVSDTGHYRYLRFNPTSVASAGPPCCGPNVTTVYGLNELRVFQTNVPEPASLTLMASAFAFAWLLRRRRA